MPEISPDTSRIKPGDILKNYVKFCEIINLKPALGGKNRAIQKQDISRHIKSEEIKGTQKIKILEILEKPEPFVDGRSDGNNSKYIEYSAPLLLDFICSEGYYTDENLFELKPMYKKDIYQSMGLCNENFYNRDSSTAEIPVSNYEIDNFFLTANSKIKDILKNSFKKLISNKKIINYESVLHISESKEKLRQATEGEVNFYKNIIKETLNEFGFLDESEVHKKHNTKSFYAEVNKRMSKELNITASCYFLLHITLNQENIRPDEDCLNEEYREEIKKKLNNLVVESLKETFNKKHIKYIASRNLCPKCLEQSKKEHTLNEQWYPYFCIPCLSKDDIKNNFSSTELNNQLNLTDYFIRDEYIGVIDQHDLEIRA